MEGLGSRHRHHLCCVWSRVTSVYWELDPITQRGEERSAVTSKQSPKGFLAGTLGSGVRKNGYILDAVTQKSHVRERAAALQGRLLEPFPPSQLPATPISSLQALKNALSGPWCPKENWPFSAARFECPTYQAVQAPPPPSIVGLAVHRGAPRGPSTGLSLRNHSATWISVGPCRGQKPYTVLMTGFRPPFLGGCWEGQGSLQKSVIPRNKAHPVSPQETSVYFYSSQCTKSSLPLTRPQGQCSQNPYLATSPISIQWTWEVLPKDPRALGLCLWNSTCRWQSGSLAQHSGPPSVQFSSFAQSCLTLCNPKGSSPPGFPAHH